MSGQLMAFNDHSDWEATERWVPFNPAVPKKVGAYIAFMILLFYCKFCSKYIQRNKRIIKFIFALDW